MLELIESETRRVRPLAFALIITSSYFVIEVIGGILTNSLALLSDAGHMLSDMAALTLSLFASQIARRPATPKRTFGYYRLEILAALVNGLALWLIVGVILHEAFYRVFNSPLVQTTGMLIVASIGLFVNVAAGLCLYSSRHDSLIIRSAFLHILGDAIGSIGAIIAGLIMHLTGLYIADPLVSILIAGLILYTSWGLIKESVDILMQSVPKGISLDEVQNSMEVIMGVVKVHDLHVWEVTSGVFTLTAHAVIDNTKNSNEILNDIEKTLGDKFEIKHTTIQLESVNREKNEFDAF